jgi:hypothetical protein
MISLQSLLVLAVLPFSAAFVSQTKTSAPLKSAVTPSKTELGLAWHDYVRNDPYTRNRNGEVDVLRSDYYHNRNRLGNMQQPYGSNYYWNDNYRNNGYYGPFSNSDASRRYGYGNGNYAYGYNSMRDGYSRVNNGRFPPEDRYTRNYGSYNNGYNSYYGNNYGYGNNYNNYGYGNYNRYGSDYNNRYGPWLNSGRFPDENGRYGYGGYNDYGYGGYNRNSYGPYNNYYSGYGSGYGNGYGSRYGYDNYNYGGYGGRAGYGRSSW